MNYEKSFYGICEEFELEPDDHFFMDDTLPKDCTKYVQMCADWSKGKNLPSHFLPATMYWLVDDDNIIGRSQIRHELNDHLRTVGGHIGYAIRPSKRNQGYGKEILRLTIEKATEMGIHEILVTCDETNIASRKIIESNGGVLEKKTDMGVDKPDKLLFWIKT